MKTKKSVNLKQILLDFFVSFDIILLIKEDLGKLIKNKFIIGNVLAVNGKIYLKLKHVMLVVILKDLL